MAGGMAGEVIGFPGGASAAGSMASEVVGFCGGGDVAAQVGAALGPDGVAVNTCDEENERVVGAALVSGGGRSRRRLSKSP